MITVKIIRMPAVVKDVTLPYGATVAEALDQADIDIDPSEKITVDGNTASGATVLTNQARVVLARGAKGN